MSGPRERVLSTPADVELDLAWSSKSGIPGFLSAVNHKQIGMRFIWTGIVFLLVGGVEGILLRIQLATSENTFLGPEVYNQIFTMHGTTMMFLFAVPFLEGLAMYLAPLQIGTRDLPFPRLNAFGYWLYLAGGIILNWSLLTGSVPDGGWFAYVPLTGAEFSPSRAIDFWLLGVTFVEIAGIIGAVELVVAILRLRAPGMSLGRMPLFVWSVLVMAAMMLIAFPFVIVASTLLELERKLGAPFYDPALGGNPLLWQHLFWIFGHPEVYIMLLPAIGAVSAVVSVNTRRSIVAYPLVVASLFGIGIVSFGLWVHHMFAVGLPVMVLSLFAVASYFIAIPSGIQVFAWIATVWQGKLRWSAPVWFVASFLVIFVLGGITGVMVATAPFDAQAHDSFFIVAHFHYVLIGGVVFPMFAGLHHWFPKMTGRRPSENGGKVACALMFVGFNVTFFPQHWLGLQGMARRVYSYDADLGWELSNMISTAGAFVLAAGFAVFLGNLLHARRAGEPVGADPWQGDTLEWATASPPPSHNFGAIPSVTGRAPLWSDGDGLADGEMPAHVAGAVRTLSRPWRGRREVLQTSVLDAHPEAIVPLPGPSYWPLLTASAVTTAIVGVLVDWWALAGGGALASIAGLVAWNESNRRATKADRRAVAADDPGLAERRDADAVFASHVPVGLSPMWWAMVVGLIAVGTISGALVYSYFYLRLDVSPWPPEGATTRGLTLPLVSLGLVAGAVTVAPTLRRGRHVATLAAAAATAGAVVQVGALAASGVAIDANAYEALVVTIEVWSALLVATAVAVRVAAVAAGAGDPRSSLGDADSAMWVGAIALWIVLWAVVHVAPEVV